MKTLSVLDKVCLGLIEPQSLPITGPLSIGNIAAEFGGDAPHSLSEYHGAAPGVPTSGEIKISDFHGKTKDNKCSSTDWYTWTYADSVYSSDGTGSRCPVFDGDESTWVSIAPKTEDRDLYKTKITFNPPLNLQRRDFAILTHNDFAAYVDIYVDTDRIQRCRKNSAPPEWVTWSNLNALNTIEFYREAPAQGAGSLYAMRIGSTLITQENKGIIP